MTTSGSLGRAPASRRRGDPPAVALPAGQRRDRCGTSPARIPAWLLEMPGRAPSLTRGLEPQRDALRLPPRAARLESEHERDGRDDAAEDLERRLQAERRHEDPGQNGGER